VQGVARHRRDGARPGAADADLGEAVHGAEDHDALHMPASIRPIAMPTSASVDEPPPNTSMVEVEPEAEVAGDEGREGRVDALVGQHAVDVGGFQAGILDGVAHRPGAERARRHA